MKTLQDLGNLAGKTVLIRCDFNVPLDKETGTKITDDGRIRAALPTIKELLSKDAKVVAVSHLGRPKGEVNPKFSLSPVATRLSELLEGTKVVAAKDVVGEDAKQVKESLNNGEVAILENVRFDPRETSKVEEEREEFAKLLVDGCDVFVSDGFGVVHRKQASVYETAKLLPHAAGLLVEKEVKALSKVTENPEKPLVAILGGSKVSDKLGVIANLLDKADTLLIGGGMAYTFEKSLGYEVGKSLLEEDQVEVAAKYLEDAKAKGKKLLIPSDVVVTPVTEEFPPKVQGTVVKSDSIPSDQQGLDVGPETVEAFKKEVLSGKTIVWNGPVGVFEAEAFANGTKGVAAALVEATKQGAYTVIGGGDSAAAVRQFGYKDSDFSHISTGGGASLEFLEGKDLPGISILS